MGYKLAEVKSIDSNNVDFYQWGLNSKIINLSQNEADAVLRTEEGRTQEDCELFYHGYLYGNIIKKTEPKTTQSFFKMVIPKIGDTVEYQVKYVDKTPRTAKVLDVISPRTMYGNIEFMAILDEKSRISGEHGLNINCSHLIRIVKYSKNKSKPINMYKYNINYDNNFMDCIFDILSDLNRRIIRRINIDRLYYLYNINGIGLEKYSKGYYCGPISDINIENNIINIENQTKCYRIKNRKKFKKWVNKNLTKIINTAEEQDIENIAIEEEIKRSYKREMEYEMKYWDE